MDDGIDRAVARRAARQHGVFTLRQALALGMRREHRATRLQSGRWLELHPCIYLIAGAPLTWEARLMAACLAAGPRGRASHRSAAVLWGLPGGSREVVELTCRRWRRARHDGVVVHETLAFDPSDTAVRNSIPVTSVEVTLLSLGAVVPAAVVEQALDVALNRSLTSIAATRSTLERLAKRGRDGCAILREILDRRTPIRGTAESPAETLLLRMLLRHGLPAPALQCEVCDGSVLVARVDAAYPALLIALEYDSYEHHTSRQALARDSARRNRLMRLGWVVITVTAEDLRNGGTEVVATLRSAMRTASDQTASSAGA